MRLEDLPKEEMAQVIIENALEMAKLRKALAAAVELNKKKDSAVKTLDQMRYVYQDGELWKPPLGRPPVFTYPTAAVDPMAVDVRSVV